MQSYASLGQAAGTASPAVLSAIKQASAESGVDFSYLLQKASVESSFNPAAKAGTSSASGLYQFIDQTWLTEISQHGAEYGLQKEAAAVSVDGSGHASVGDSGMRQEILALKNDPKVAAEMAASFTKDNQQSLQASVGGKIGSTELYLAHFLGAGGAAKFLSAMRSSPNEAAADVMPQAADANEAVFYRPDGTARSLTEVYSRFSSKFGGTGSAVAATTPASQTTIGTASFTPTPAFTTAPADLANSGQAESAFGSATRASLYEMLLLSQLSKMDTGGQISGDRGQEL
jgi:hypothetical protein